MGSDQHQHWEQSYRTHPGMYGEHPSEAAVYSAEFFHGAGVREILELGAGHGRDTLYLARSEFEVTATDFSAVGLTQMNAAAEAGGLADRIRTLEHDARDPIPQPDDAFDAVFAHMLLCMNLSTEEILALAAEIRRVLRPGGILVYTVRHDGDAHYGNGIAHGDDIYEHGGFAVHFFTRTLVDEIAESWDLTQIHPFEEGDLPRRLWRITQTKPLAPTVSTLDTPGSRLRPS
ncbi:class I SAM-dependent methyltransferase [Nocardia brasiliensis]|uniref:class I SAM-dependent methyltransferase n=1 Tax=Nocardia brasiliensis TaxID=37326 RepID=UPI0024540FCF|nr:class I SAM-dependent methyltransferase [Nocardia brasiliensis]